MEPLEPGRPAPRRRQRTAALALVLAAAATFGTSAATLALFTDSDAPGGAWSSGTIILGTSPATVFTATGLMPGAAGSQTVSVANPGTGDLRYAMTSAATDADGKGLRGQLQLTIRAGGCTTPGAFLYTGPLDGASLGDPAQGGDPGDRVVGAGATDDLCFAWTFPSGSGPAFQDAGTSATFSFDAEQTANNP